MKLWSLLACIHSAGFALTAGAATFTVTTIGDSGPGSLRQAVTSANATPGMDFIQFNIPPGGPQIVPLLGTGLSITAPLAIDGSTQPGFSGQPMIILAGAGGAAPGLLIATSNCLIRSLVISNFAGNGIALESDARNNVIGGTNSGAGNRIVGNSSSGIAILSGTNNAIRGNSIADNGGLGIDVGDDGITLNDNRDPDSGPNQLQNYPILSSATISSNSVVITGSLNSRVNVSFQIDFFANRACHASGSGEGQTYLGTRTVTTSGTGIGSFSFTLPVPAPGRFLTATATDPLGNTSEFSPCLRAGGTMPPLSLSVVNTNDGGPGSLRQAALDLGDRVTFGTNTVRFAIPGTNVHTIAPASPWPAFFDPVVLDGYSQAGASPNSMSNGFNAQLRIQLDGANAGPGAAGLILRGDASTVRGLAVISFRGGGLRVMSGSNVIQGNLIGVDVDGFPSGNGVGDEGGLSYPGLLLMNSVGSIVGGASASARNVISANGTDGIWISGAASSGNQVLGNFIGTDATGMVGFGNANAGVNLDGASASIVGGTAAGAGNLISWNGSGVQMALGVSNRIQGNLIGADVTGTNALGNGFGVALVDSSYNQIGGTNAAARNLIVANGQGGIAVSGASGSNVIHGNIIGTDATGQQELGNGAFGIHLDTGDGNQIGGTNAGVGNLIAFNGGHGVEIGDGLRNAILGNSIFRNGGLGIDLGGDGVTLNDPGDSDAGPNALQNFPELASAVIYTNRTIVRGTLRSRPGVYLIQLFENATCDDSGSGEGQTLLTNLTATVPAGGLVSLNYTNTSLFQAGYFITATATDVSNNTSEFSACMKLVSFGSVDLAVTQADSVDPVELLSNVTYTITVTNSGPTNATGVVLTDLLPPALTYVSATPSQGSCSYAGGVVTCQLNSINQGASATISVKSLAAMVGLVENVVSVTANQVDNTSENNTASESTRLGVADLGVTVVDSPDPVLTGQLLTYSVTVTNRGPNPASGTVLTWLGSSFAPAAEIFSVTVSQGVLNLLDGSATLGAIPVDGSAVLTLKIVPLAAEAFELQAAVSSAEADLDLSNNEAMEVTGVNAGSGVVQFGNAEYTVNEGGGAVEVTLVRVGGDLGTVGVGYATSNSTAEAGSDFVHRTGSVIFGPGETSTILSLPILDDAVSECNEDFTLTLSGPIGFPVLIGKNRVTVTIFDNDLPPQGTVAGVSVKSGNPASTGNASSSAPSVSTEGRWVAFASAAGDLGPADGNGVSDVFVRDLANGTTRLGSANRFGTGSGNAASDQPILAANGRYLAFASLASDLVTNNVAAAGNVFVRNLTTEVTSLVSVSTNGVNGGSAASQSPVISSNGLAVAFTSSAVDLVALPNSASTLGVYVRDLTTATTRMVSVNRLGTGAANGGSDAPRISANGRWVAFESEASDLVAGDTNGYVDVFVRDTLNGVTLLAGVRSSGAGSGNGSSCCASLSGDGRYVTFSSEATDLLSASTVTSGNIFVRDLVMGTTRLVSVSTNTFGGNGPCRNPVITGDGRYVAFSSDASDLVLHDLNGQGDVFVRDLLLDSLTLISVGCDGFGSGNAPSDLPSISEDGQLVAFLSLANHLVPGQFPADRWQAFRRDLNAGATSLLSINHSPTGGGNDDATAALLSANGRTAVFVSTADDLGLDDQNGASDVFAWTAPEPILIADLALSIAPPEALPPFGQQLRYTVTVSNRGPAMATGVVLVDVVSGMVGINSVVVSQGSAIVNGASVFAQLGTIPAQSSASATLTVSPAGVSFTNSASTAGFESDDNQANNTISVSVPVNAVSRPPLSIQNAGGHFVLEWPTATPPGFLLETTAALTASNAWSVISNATNPFVITNAPGEPSRFYRLRMP